MNAPLNTYNKRTGPVRPVFANPYAYRAGIAGLGDCGDGTDPVFDSCCATAEGCGSTIITPSGPAPEVPYDPSQNPTSLTPTPTTQGPPITVVDYSGVTWTCDQNGNCCDPSNNCQQGAPATQAPSGGTTQPAAATSTNQANANLITALAAAAAKTAAITQTVGGGSVQCGNGVAVPAGQRCPSSTTPSLFGCPTGSTSVNGVCVPGAAKPVGQWFTSMSNTQVILIAGGTAVLLGLVASLSGGGGRRRR